MEYKVLVDNEEIEIIKQDIRTDIEARNVIKKWAWQKGISPKGVRLKINKSLRTNC